MNVVLSEEQKKIIDMICSKEYLDKGETATCLKDNVLSIQAVAG